MADNVSIIKELYAAFDRRDIQGIVDLCTPDTDWELVGPPVLPSFGRFHGPQGVVQFFTAVASELDVQSFTQKQFIAEGDYVVALCQELTKVLSTGKTYETTWPHIWKLSGGKVAQWRGYQNSGEVMLAATADLAEAGS